MNAGQGMDMHYGVRTVVLENGILAGLIHCEVEAHVWHHADDAGQPAPPQR